MAEKYIPFFVPSIGNEEIREVAKVMRSGWITSGQVTEQFENEFKSYIGCKYTAAVNSGTAALHLALDAIGLRPDDEVITSPMTFAATTEVILYFRARPVFVDCAASSDSRPSSSPQLPPPKLGEHLADPRGLRETHRDEIAAVDLEVDVAESCEVLAKSGVLLSPQGEQWGVEGECVCESDDVGGVEPVGAQSLGDPRADRDRTDDQVDVAASHLQAHEPVVRLRRCLRPSKGGEAEAPSGHLDTELGAEGQGPPEQRGCLFVTAKMRMDRPVDAEISEPLNAGRTAGILEQEHELVAKPRGREVADEPHLDARTRKAHGVLVEPEAVPRLVADAAEDPRRVV